VQTCDEKGIDLDGPEAEETIVKQHSAFAASVSAVFNNPLCLRSQRWSTKVIESSESVDAVNTVVGSAETADLGDAAAEALDSGDAAEAAAAAGAKFLASSMLAKMPSRQHSVPSFPLPKQRREVGRKCKVKPPVLSVDHVDSKTRTRVQKEETRTARDLVRLFVHEEAFERNALLHECRGRVGHVHSEHDNVHFETLRFGRLRA
jgi:hypothetical protein